MTPLNTNNIEERIFDYHEGNLSPAEMVDVDTFVNANPEFQVDFDAWKESYFESEDSDYAYANTLLAGTGATWMTWAVISLFLIGSSIGLVYALNHDTETLLMSDNFSAPSPDQKIASNSDQKNVWSDLEGSPLNKSSESESLPHNIEAISDNRSTKPHVVDNENNQSNNVLSNDKHNFSNQFKATNTKVNTDTDKKDKFVPKPSGSKNDIKNVSSNMASQKLNKHKTDNELLAALKEDKSVTNKSMYKSDQSKPGAYDDLALAQAVNSFKDKNRSSANLRQYGESFPKITLEMRHHHRKFHKMTMMDKLMSSIAQELRYTSNYGFQNYNDPYFLIPEFYTPNLHNGGFAGSSDGFRAKIGHRYSNNSHTSTAAIDTRIGHDFGVGIGVFGSNTFSKNTDGLDIQKTDLALYISPKIKINKNASLEPSLNINYSDVNVNFKNTYVGSVELERGRIFTAERPIPGDTIIVPIVQYVNRNYDFGAGMLFNTKQFYLGVSVNNIGNRFNKIGYNDLTIDHSGNKSTYATFTAVAGTDYKFNQHSNNAISPNIVFKQTGRFTDLWLGTTIKYNKLFFGLSYGNHLEGAGLIGIQTSRIRLGMTTDYTKSNLLQKRTFSYGGTFRLLIGKQSKTTDLPRT